jgi:hypothetical protein
MEQFNAYDIIVAATAAIIMSYFGLQMSNVWGLSHVFWTFKKFLLSF